MTNISKENIYWDYSGKIPQSLNASLQESLVHNPLIALIILFWILKICRKMKGKFIPVTGLGGLLGSEMLTVPHCLGNDSWLAVRTSTLPAGRILPPTLLQKHLQIYFLVLICVRDWVDSTAILRLERLGTFYYIQLFHWESNPRPSGL
jgi:hypothetical protein